MVACACKLGTQEVEQEDQKFGVFLTDVASSRSAWAMWNPVSRRKTKAELLLNGAEGNAST